MDYQKDYYKILEVDTMASKEAIRAAYRRLAKQYHPDKNAGDAALEEQFKQINEANEILSNPILKQEYDAYRTEQERWERARAAQKAENETIKSSNRNTYIRTSTVVTETKIYLTGEITVKYWADCPTPQAATHNTVLDFKIHPTEVEINIHEEQIFPEHGIPVEFLRAYKESDIFTVPLPQPVHCSIAGSSGKEYYQLTLNDIRIKDIRLEGITKHENKSYGTLIGQFYGYSPKMTYEQVEETVTECFGETGRVERKNEGGYNYIRKEYYHPDCSTYWGNWIQLPVSAPFPAAAASFNHTHTVSDPGCGLIATIIAALVMVLLSPKFFLFCLFITGMGLLLRHGNRIFSSASRLLSLLAGGLLFFFLVTAVRSIYTRENNNLTNRQNATTVKTTRSVRRPPAATGDTTASPDTLITHFLKWEDYTGNQYEGNISISIAALQKATALHRQMKAIFYKDISDVYTEMLENDSSGLVYLYETFDSLRLVRKLDDIAFSSMVVSAIQSQSYYLVLDRGCDETYNDAFTRNYLANCQSDCCVGNAVFGVRSPVEFLSDLKGDCDTRSLLLYQVFKHYNYDVALLTSDYYKHAMIAVHLPETTDGPALTMTIDDKRYYMWETTSPHLKYGQVPANLGNLSYWNISLLNKKI